MRAIDARKQDWQGYNNLGIFYDRIGRHREAIESYEHALDLTPDNAAVDSNLGAVYVNSSDPSLYPQAERLLRRSIDFNPTFDAYTNLGNLYMLEKRYPESAQASEKALTMNTKNYTVWNNLLEVCEQLGNHARAAEARKQIRNLAEAAIRLNEKNADAHSMLALALAKEKERESALAHIRTALALEPEDQSVLAQVAEAYESLGQRDSAIRCLKLAIRKGFPRSQIIGDASLEHIAADPHFRS
jgi:serine/threonine-protein kinase